MKKDFLKYISSDFKDLEYTPYGYLTIMDSIERKYFDMSSKKSYEKYVEVIIFIDENFLEICEGLNSKNIKIKRDCARLLGNFYDERSVDPLIYSLTEKNRGYRYECIKSLSKISLVSKKPLLRELKNSNKYIRLGTIKSLIKIKDEESNNEFVKKIKNLELKNHCKIIHIDEKTLYKYINALNDDYWAVRLNTIYLLMGFDIPNLIDLIYPLINDSSSKVRHGVVSCLFALYNFNILYNFEENLDSEEYLRCYYMLNNILMKSLKDKSTKVRMKALENLYRGYLNNDISKKILFFINESHEKYMKKSEELIYFVDEINSKKNITIIKDLIADKLNFIENINVLRNFLEDYQKEDLKPYLESSLYDNNEKIRKYAVSLLRRYYNDNVNSLIINIYEKEENLEVRKEILNSFPQERKYREFFKIFAKDKDEIIWRDAFYYLKKEHGRLVSSDKEDFIKDDNLEKNEYKLWLKNLNNNKPLDFGNNCEYIYKFLHQIISNFIENKDIDRLLSNIKLIENNFNEYLGIINDLNILKADAYFILENYDKSFEFRKKTYLSFYDLFLYGPLLESPENIINSKWILDKWGRYLTDLGIKNKKEIINYLDDLLDEKDFKNKNILISFINKNYKYEILSGNELKNLERYFIEDNKDVFLENKYEKLKKQYLNEKNNSFETIMSSEYCIFRTFLDVNLRFLDENYFYKELFVPDIILESFRNFCKELIMKAENKFRLDNNYHLTTEKWISEANLFKKIVDLFPEELVLKHQRPGWLGRQHFDIFLPFKNIAIEYQGDPHLRPVPYFGGEEGFNNTLERDKRKKKLCELNNCKLIEVFPNYDINFVEKQIKEAINTE